MSLLPAPSTLAFLMSIVASNLHIALAFSGIREDSQAVTVNFSRISSRRCCLKSCSLLDNYWQTVNVFYHLSVYCLEVGRGYTLRCSYTHASQHARIYLRGKVFLYVNKYSCIQQAFLTNIKHLYMLYLEFYL